MSALTQTQAVEGEVDLTKLKKFIAYCRAKCGPGYRQRLQRN